MVLLGITLLWMIVCDNENALLIQDLTHQRPKVHIQTSRPTKWEDGYANDMMLDKSSVSRSRFALEFSPPHGDKDKALGINLDF